MNAYDLIRGFYGDRRAKRSGVPLINHIDEGLRILTHLCASREAMDAFCIHPLLQHDNDLQKGVWLLSEIPGPVVALAMEYRAVANACLSDCVGIYMGRPYWVDQQGPGLSVLADVNLMLIADKVQNRADFLRHHGLTHPRAAELDFYFVGWLKALGVPVQRYLELVDVMRGPTQPNPLEGGQLGRPLAEQIARCQAAVEWKKDN
jgi:hypothetical protein